MRLNKFAAKNFRAVKDASIDDFTRINLFVGLNGHGKSSLMQGLRMPFTGLQYAMRDYIHEDADSFELIHDFDHAGFNFYIETSHNSAGKTSQFMRETTPSGEVIEYHMPSEVKKRLYSMYNPKTTAQSSIVEQHQSIAILKEGKEQIENLKEVFNIEEVDVAAAVLDEDKIANEARILELKEQIATILTTISEIEVPQLGDAPDDAKRAEMVAELERLEELHAEAETQLEFINGYNDAMSEYNEAKSRREQLFADMAVAKTEMMTAEDKIVAYRDGRGVDEIAAALEANTTLRDGAHSIREELNEISDPDEMEEKARDGKAAADALFMYKRTGAALTNDLQKIANRQNAIQDDIISLRKKEAEAELEVERSEHHLDLVLAKKCGECEQEYEGDPEAATHKCEASAVALKSIQEQRLALFAQEKELAETAQKLREEITLNAASIKANADNALDEEEVQALLVSAESTRKTRDEIEARLKTATAGILSAEEVAAMTAYVAGTKKVRDDLLKAKTKYETLEQQYMDEPELAAPEEPENLEALKTTYSGKAMSDLEDALFDAKSDVKVYDSGVETYNRNVRLYRQRTSQKRELQTEIDNVIQPEITRLQLENDALNEAIKYLQKRFSAQLINDGSAQIVDYMNVFFDATYGRYHLKMTPKTRGIKFEYSRDQKKYRDVKLAGAGEKDMIGLSYKMAQCRVSTIGLFFGDEVDNHAHDDLSIAVLMNLIAEPFEQEFLVTHNTFSIESLLTEPEVSIYMVHEGRVLKVGDEGVSAEVVLDMLKVEREEEVNEPTV